MNTTLKLQHFTFQNISLGIYAPVEEAVRQKYQSSKLAGENTAFPYWARVWPASIALAEFIAANPYYAAGKNVLELAGGLGLPSFIAAQFAANVCLSDHAPAAIAVAERSMHYNNITNMELRVIDWRRLPGDIAPDLVLLSDINYAPAYFQDLFSMVLQFLSKKVTVILSTPQRLVGKSFIEQVMPFCTKHSSSEVKFNGSVTGICIYVLNQSR